MPKLQALIRNSPDLVFGKNSDGYTPLHSAAEKGHRAVAEFLLASKAEVNSAENYGMTPLSLAAMNGHKELAEILIANQADVNAKGSDGATALHMASAHGRTTTVEVLLARKADANAKDKSGLTPLHWAVAKKHEDAVKVLVAGNADLNAEDNDGETALSLAEAFGLKRVSDFLRSKGAKGKDNNEGRDKQVKIVINTKKLDDSALIAPSGKVIGLWFKTREEATDTKLMVGVMVLHQMQGRTIEQSDFEACHKSLCRVTPHNGGYLVLFPSGDKGGK